MKAIRILEKAASPDAYTLGSVEVETPVVTGDQCLIEVKGSGVNPSDTKAALGKMPNLAWPRTPGRDYAGVVVEGPSEMIGKEVWGGGGGDIGMTRDGAHAQYLVVDAKAVREKPAGLSFYEAGGIGVPFTCAYMGIIDGACVEAGETVVVFGANGKVGEAVIQLATMAGAKVIGVVRQQSEYLGHANAPVDIINASDGNVTEAIMDRTDGRGADIVFNTVGSPYFELGCECMGKQARHVIISTFDLEVPFDIKRFYRGNHRMVGVSNIDLDCFEAADMFEKMAPGFESGNLKPYPVSDRQVYSIDDVDTAYRTVLKGSKDRIVIDPQR